MFRWTNIDTEKGRCGQRWLSFMPFSITSLSLITFSMTRCIRTHIKMKYNIMTFSDQSGNLSNIKVKLSIFMPIVIVLIVCMLMLWNLSVKNVNPPSMMPASATIQVLILFWSSTFWVGGPHMEKQTAREDVLVVKKLPIV